MKPIFVPTTDVNTESVTVRKHSVPEGTQVQVGDVVAEVETSKALVELSAVESGFVGFAKREGFEISILQPIAYTFSTESALTEWKKARDTVRETDTSKGYTASAKAEALAKEHGIDLGTLGLSRLITQKDVEQAVATQAHKSDAPKTLPSLIKGRSGSERVLIIGAGKGATQVLDIFTGYPEKQAVGLIDDDTSMWGEELYGLPVVGGSGRIAELYQAKGFDTAIISISTSVKARAKLRALCEAASIPLTNAIDKSCRIGMNANLGSGNVFCAFCHIGNGTVVGNNNFLSAYNSIDHHCKIGSDLSTGPGCMASGFVTIGSRVRMGTGIFIQPYLEIGDDVDIASGAIILKTIPAKHAIKTKVFTTAVVSKEAS